jgi:hypothetical protein
MSIDKTDHGVINEARTNTLKNFLISEMNGFNEYLLDLGVEQVFHKVNTGNLDEECITVYFQNLKKLMKSMKIRLTEKDNEIGKIYHNKGLLNYDKKEQVDQIIRLKQNTESYNKISNLNVKDDELSYYKNLVGQNERVSNGLTQQIDDLREKSLNNSYSELHTVNNQTKLHYNYDNSIYSPMGTIENQNKENYNKTEKRNIDIGSTKYTPYNEENNTSFENFRRNKVIHFNLRSLGKR